jgi:lipid A 4'-phosphatase
MCRRGVIVALAIATVVGLVFGFFPRLDVDIADLFYDPAAQTFPLRTYAGFRYLREAATWMLVLFIAPAVLALLVARARRWISARAAIFLILTLALAPGLLANLVLKDHWSRPRPVAITEFGGSEHFVPWWDPRGECRRNCSFVSGEVSSAFWTLAPATLAPPSWRALAYAAALTFGVGMGLVRMAMGAHFFTDAIFAGVFTFLIIFIVHGLVFRPRTGAAGAKIEMPPKTP